MEFQCLQHAFRRSYLFYPRIDSEALHKPCELFGGKLPKFIFTSWPFEFACFKSLVQEKEAIALPNEGFDTIIPSATEQKYRSWGKRIKSESFLDGSSKTIYAVAKICISTGYICLIKPGFT